jgi:hypothetical protein
MVLPIKTIQDAIRYRAYLRELGKDHVIFAVATNTKAYRYGYRFGTCARAEREMYEIGGAIFVNDKGIPLELITAP